MSRKYLGDSFDIHGGGQDLIFPHHENEVAQSEGASGKQVVNSWIHHGFVTIRDEKMSKSLGNFLTIREILKQYHPEVLRLFIFSTHYRNPLDFSEAAMQDAMTGLDRLYGCMAAINDLRDRVVSEEEGEVIASTTDRDKLHTLENRFQKAMDDDFNTAQGLGILFDAARIINKIIQQLPTHPHPMDIKLLQEAGNLIKKLAGIMGLLQEEAKEYLGRKKTTMLEGLAISEHEILQLIQERKDARAAKDWARGDSIRDRLLAMGIELKDSANTTTWEAKRG
jgi:cysteinyl-tRNA synthetase